MSVKAWKLRREEIRRQPIQVEWPRDAVQDLAMTFSATRALTANRPLPPPGFWSWDPQEQMDWIRTGRHPDGTDHTEHKQESEHGA